MPGPRWSAGAAALLAATALLLLLVAPQQPGPALTRPRRSVQDLVRAEVKTIQARDLFLDVFVPGEFTQYGGLELEPGDAAGDPAGPVALADVPPAPARHRLRQKTRLVREVGDQQEEEEEGGQREQREDCGILEQLQQLARTGNSSSAEFRQLLLQYTQGEFSPPRPARTCLRSQQHHG